MLDDRYCCICKNKFDENQLISEYGISREITDLIKMKYPDWSKNCKICLEDLNQFRRSYIQNLVREERGKIESLEQEVINSIHDSEFLAKNPTTTYSEKTSFGDRIADKVAKFGGSWNFIITFFIILLLWIILNGFVLLNQAFDPYPFILMNLILSCIAAIQAPIIMMSQNRQESKDRIRSENDYQINLKAEIEIRTLHEKVDHLLLDQWSRLMKTQEIQMEMLEELSKDMKKYNKE
ncbi:MAG TPA: hypothetical protein DIW31_08665 [Bacteroidales bacterium]|nr:hypothetical protein [Bacteroidales bacterium]